MTTADDGTLRIYNLEKKEMIEYSRTWGDEDSIHSIEEIAHYKKINPNAPWKFGRIVGDPVLKRDLMETFRGRCMDVN